ncbi:protein TWIN LOV 1-like isoform X3 [Triticum dicoccoides]|uniref:protein TWIN LOV 1-like isoform X3 n=1 Tax=Triticum dicoccoides TaxID=85692 RepID=UPI00188E1C77|nr:protein TWIN LOV 1-like isoform X3 [Triticum dicoccoides]XP_044347572.1 protein TWIN LOV 1-like isoform X3 [Triticum aestivum]
MEGEERRLAASLTARYSEWVLEELDELRGSFLLTDPAMPGHPIVYASRGLASLTGYPRRELLGRNARLFQGAATDRAAVSGVREAVRTQRAHQVAILNYRRDGSPHWVLLHLAPVFHAADGRVLHFLAVQVPIAAAPRRHPGRPAAFAACREEARGEEELPCASHVGEVFVDIDKRGMETRRRLEAEEPRIASVCDKEMALSTANKIFSTLNRYSKLTGLVVCERRCDSVGIPALSSSLNLSLGRIKQSFVLTDRHLPDMPIVYASDAFLSLTGKDFCCSNHLTYPGYSREEILGCNCRFLNGPGTSAEVLEEINQHICLEEACTVHLLNYRKDGSTFRDLLHVSPIRNSSGKVAFHVWVHLDESAKHDFSGLTPEVWQLGAVGAVRVAVRSLSASGSLLRPSQ